MSDASEDAEGENGERTTAQAPSDEVRERLDARLRDVRTRIAAAAERAGRDAGKIQLVAVTKTVPVAVIRAAYDLGLTTFGENRVQEAREKIGQLQLPGARWELIGHLQTNKVAQAAQLFERIQSVDSVRLAESLDARAAHLGRRLGVLLEVNVAGEASKSGFAPDELSAAAAAIAALPHLAPEGLMTVAPVAADPEAVRPVFRRLRELRDHLRETEHVAPAYWEHLSMGMSDDFEVAIEEGATLIRLGRALFGARPTP